MSVQIADATDFITITRDGVVRFTLPKRETVLEVDGNTLELRNSGYYVDSVLYSDVSSPVTANVEALRTAVNNFLIT